MSFFDDIFGSSSSSGTSDTNWGNIFDTVTNDVSKVAGGINSVASAVSNAAFGWQDRKLEETQKQAAIDIAKTNAQTAQQLQQAQAAYTLQQAQQNPSSVFGNASDVVANALASINGKISGTGGGTSSLMLILTVLGVGFAAFQFMGKK
ncbi:MAG TPA: hypothetical protein VIE69_06970 [Methylophilaceae bacterium]|jgi:hypothetical protein